MNPLVVAGGVSKKINPLLVDGKPITGTQLLTYGSFQIERSF